MNKEIQANQKVFAEEMNKEKTNNDAQLNILRQKLDNNISGKTTS